MTSILAQESDLARRKTSSSILALSLAVLLVWLFPPIWYSKTDPNQECVWLAEQGQVPGWQYKDLPLSDAAEAALAADKIVNGEFTKQDKAVVRVFSAKRYSDTQSAFDMFSHTPDRCWTSVGWRLEPTTPDAVELNLYGIPLLLERRIFVNGPRRELVYFGALVGGQPLPYRLDQYRTIAIRRSTRPSTGILGKMFSAMDARFFSWPWTSFVKRRPLYGPKQFIRVSTPIEGTRAGEADAALREFLLRWLSRTDYRRELEQWQTSR